MQHDNYVNNNNISVIGVIASEKKFSHQVFGEGFYNFTIEVERLSETSDFLPVTISERIIDNGKFLVGETVYISGQIRSYNNYVESEGRNRLVLTIFVRDFEILPKKPIQNTDININIDIDIETEAETDNSEFSGEGHQGDIEDETGLAVESKYTKNPNDVLLNGYICKQPIYRTTPFGREIADILIAVNRSYNKSDYIPCIAWGRNARFSSRLTVGDNIKVWGRMQSRVYQKKLEDGTAIEKTAYEVSISKLELSDDEYIENNNQEQDQNQNQDNAE